MEATFCTLFVTTGQKLCGYYFTEHIRSNGSHFMYTRCYNNIRLVLLVTTLVTTGYIAYIGYIGLYHWLLHWLLLVTLVTILVYMHTVNRCYYCMALYDGLLQSLNIIPSTFGSHFMYTRCFYIN